MTTDNTSRDTADRMDLPFVGLATFAHQPAWPDWGKLNGADVTGMPFERHRAIASACDSNRPRGFHVQRPPAERACSISKMSSRI
jgi:hypothetical protein